MVEDATTETAAEETVIHIDTLPAHATILIGGAMTVEIRHAGYQTIKEKVIPDVNQRLKLTLVAARDPATAGSAPYRKFE